MSTQLPERRAPLHPGEILAEEFLRPLGLTQVAVAERLAIPFQRLNQVVRGRRAVTPDTALRLAQFFGTSAELWLNLQQRWDLHHAARAPASHSISTIRPLRKPSPRRPKRRAG